MSIPEAYPHQKEIVELSRVHNSLGLWWEMGTGKTRGIIDILRDKFNTHQRHMRTLVVTPLVTVYNWKEEILKYSKIKKEKILVVDCNGAKRNKLIARFLDHNEDCIIVMNYEALQTDAVMDMMRAWGPEIMIADEIHLIKSPKAKRAKRAIILGDLATYRYGLSGTPILNNISDIWNQYRFLDGGERFGRNFYVFQRKYMINKNEGNRWVSYPDWVARPSMFPVLNEKIYEIATRITKEECLKDLPPLVTMRRDVTLGKDQQKAYDQMKKEFITFVRNAKTDKSEAVVAQLALTKALRLLQIVTGHVMTEEGNVIEFDDVPRLKETESILTEITPNHKVILWCSFKNNYSQLSKLCKKLKLEHVFLTGEQNIKQKQESMEEFKNNENCKVIIANRRAGGIGVNLVEASYSIVYSRNFSLGEEKQSESRNHRGGSQMHEQVTKIDLCAKGTIDELVLESLDSKQKISDKIIDWVEEL